MHACIKGLSIVRSDPFMLWRIMMGTYLQPLPLSIRLAGFSFGLMLLCSCATRDSIRPPLPAETSFNQEAGRGGDLRLKLHLESGEELNCLLDTGSSFTILEKALEPKLGKRLGTKYTRIVQAVTTNGSYRAPGLYLGNAPLRTGSRIQTDDLAKGTAILGMDCLQHYCIQLDFSDRKIRFLNPDDLKANELGQGFPLTLSKGHAVVHADFMGIKRGDWAVDTGLDMDGLLTALDFDRALHDQPVTPVMMGINGLQSRGVCFPKGGFGSNSYYGLIFGEIPRDIKWLPKIIGLPFLARNLVTFNFPKRVMYLKQTSAGPLTSGYTLSFEADKFLMNLNENGKLTGW